MKNCLIKSFIVHKLNKDQHGAATISEGPSLLTVNDAIQSLVDEIDQKYKTQSRSFGKFEDNNIEFPLQKYIEDNLLNTSSPDFLKFSKDALLHLQVTATDINFATGGWVVMCDYVSQGENFVVIAIVNDSKGAAVNETTYVVSTSIYVDLNKLRHAGRVNIDKWQSGTNNKYVSFLRKGKETTYFQKFLGCNDIQERRVESDKLVNAVKKFTQTLSEEASKDSIYKLSHTYLLSLIDENKELELETFCNHVYPSNPTILKEYLCSEEISLSTGFVPDRTSISRFSKFTAKGNDWQLSFSRDAIRNFSYDASTRTLTIEVKNDAAHQVLCDEVISQHKPD